MAGRPDVHGLIHVTNVNVKNGEKCLLMGIDARCFESGASALKSAAASSDRA
jgi:hypothetical protein